MRPHKARRVVMANGARTERFPCEEIRHVHVSAMRRPVDEHNRLALRHALRGAERPTRTGRRALAVPTDAHIVETRRGIDDGEGVPRVHVSIDHGDVGRRHVTGAVVRVCPLGVGPRVIIEPERPLAGGAAGTTHVVDFKRREGLVCGGRRVCLEIPSRGGRRGKDGEATRVR